MQTQNCPKCIDVVYTLTAIQLKIILLLMLHVACYQASEAASSDKEKSIQFCQ